MIEDIIAYVCDADKSHTIISRFLRRLISVETISNTANFG